MKNFWNPLKLLNWKTFCELIHLMPEQYKTVYTALSFAFVIHILVRFCSHLLRLVATLTSMTELKLLVVQYNIIIQSPACDQALKWSMIFEVKGRLVLRVEALIQEPQGILSKHHYTLDKTLKSNLIISIPTTLETGE